MVNPIGGSRSNLITRRDNAAAQGGHRLGGIGPAAHRPPAHVGAGLPLMRAATRTVNRLGLTGRPSEAETQLINRLQAWASQPHGPSEHRDTALARLMVCLSSETENRRVDLSDLGLTSLPDVWPPHLVEVDARQNPLPIEEVVKFTLAMRQFPATVPCFRLPPLPTILEQIHQLSLTRGTELSVAERQLIGHWTDWSIAAHASSECRDIAVMRLIESLRDTSGRRVDLSGLGLTSLPDRQYFAHFAEVIATDNPLSASELAIHHLARRQAGAGPTEFQVPPLPTLQEQIAQLRLAQGSALDVGVFRLIACWVHWAREPYDARTEHRDIALMLMISSMSVSTHRHLKLSGLGLTTLPGVFPTNMHELDVSRNALTDANWLPQYTTVVLAAHNRISTLPPGLSHELRELDLSDNHVLEFPPQWLERSSALTLRLRGNPMPGDRILRLQVEMSRPLRARRGSLQGDRRAHYPLSDFGDVGGTVTPWVIAASHWLFPNQSLSWRSFEGENNSAHFKDFLTGLARTESYSNLATREHFRKAVASLLNRMETHADLRRACFALSETAAGASPDGAALAFCGIESAALADQVRRGDFDRRLSDLLTVLQQLYRRDALENIARALCNHIGATNLIEVRLALLTQLNSRLNLGLTPQNRVSSDQANLTPDDLDAAFRSVLREHPVGFRNYLTHPSGLWNNVFERTHTAARNQAVRVAIERAISSDEFGRRVAARQAVLVRNEYANPEHVARTEVRNEMTWEAQSPYIYAFMRHCGLATPGPYLESLNRPPASASEACTIM